MLVSFYNGAFLTRRSLTTRSVRIHESRERTVLPVTANKVYAEISSDKGNRSNCY